VAKERRRFEAAEKVKIIREHLLDGKPLSQVCEKHGIAPTQFYQWQKTFFENGMAAFEPKKAAAREYELENKVKQLDKKLVKKDEVIAELVEHNISLKKSHGMD
jgi:transposase